MGVKYRLSYTLFLCLWPFCSWLSLFLPVRGSFFRPEMHVCFARDCTNAVHISFSIDVLSLPSLCCALRYRGGCGSIKGHGREVSTILTPCFRIYGLFVAASPWSYLSMALSSGLNCMFALLRSCTSLMPCISLSQHTFFFCRPFVVLSGTKRMLP